MPLAPVIDALLPWGGVLASIGTLGAIATYRAEAYLRSELLTYGAAAGWLGLLLWWREPEAAAWPAGLWLIAFVAGGIGVLGWYRFGAPYLDRVQAFLTRPSALVRAGRTDVRDIAKRLPPPRREYDPRTFHRADAFFLGLDPKGQPLYWQGALPHVAVVGTTGAGKGRKLQDLAAQSVAMGEALVYLDPKDDEWGPHALFAACAAAERPYHYVALRPDAPPQFNLIAGAAAWEIEELLSAGLDLGDKGKGADFFKAKDRAAARHAAQLAAAGGLTLAAVHAAMAGDDYWCQEAPGFLDKLGELAALPAIHAPTGGVALATLIAEGGGLYVVGSMTLQAARRAQQMLFVRVQQLASARDRMSGSQRIVCVIADEAKYHLSRPILQGLGASRDKGMRVVLALQSFLDLRDCPADLDPDAVLGAVIENTPAKLIYRLEDPDTAEWLARKAGTILVDDETRVLGRNLALAETSAGERSLREAEHFLIDLNQLTHLPPGWAVLYGQGIARLCYVSPYRVAKSPAAIAVVAAAGDSVAAAADAEAATATPVALSVNSAPRPRGSDRDAAFFALDDE